MAATAARRRPDDPPTIPVLATAALLLVAGAGCSGPSDVPRAAGLARHSTPALAGERKAAAPRPVPGLGASTPTPRSPPGRLRTCCGWPTSPRPRYMRRSSSCPGRPIRPGRSCSATTRTGLGVRVLQHRRGLPGLTLDPDRLGEPRACRLRLQNPPPAPTAREYAEAFITAWQTGNRARMAALATPEVIRAFDRLAPHRRPATSWTG